MTAGAWALMEEPQRGEEVRLKFLSFQILEFLARAAPGVRRRVAFVLFCSMMELKQQVVYDVVYIFLYMNKDRLIIFLVKA